MFVLGIETTCDETAVGIVHRDGAGRGRLLANVVFNQNTLHQLYGGVVPEIAARAHVERLDAVMMEAIKQAELKFSSLDAIAASAGPGLVGGVIVGLTAGKALALALQKPFSAVNHLEGHALSPRLVQSLNFPYLLLLVSGGHTQLLAVEGVGQYRRLGTTLDDAAGEAFDKVAKMLGLGYPGGAEVEKAALQGSPTRFVLPRPMLGRPEPDFSFAGLKTAVRLEAERLQPLNSRMVADLCASFQAAVTDVMADRVRAAFRIFHQHYHRSPTALVVAGGVAANLAISDGLKHVAKEAGIAMVTPPLELCGDNGAMIAWAGAERVALGLTDDFSAPVRPRWPLDTRAAGSGQKA